MRHWKDDGESRNEVLDSWPCGVLDRPNEYETAFDLMKRLVSAQLFRGNGYLYALRNRRNQIDTLHCLFPDHVWPYRVPGSTDYFYQVASEPMAELDLNTMVPPRMIFHHRMLTMGDPLVGFSPLMSAAVSASAGLAIMRQSERFFHRMARPSGVLSTSKMLDERVAERIKERWQKIYAGEEGAGDVAVLEEGLEWKPLTMTAVDAQLIEQLRYYGENVATVFRLPLFMLGDVSKTNYSNAEQLTHHYLDGCLSAHLTAIEWRLTRYFDMDGRKEYLEFDRDVLLRTDMKTRIEALARAVQGGLHKPDEARRILGLNPVPGGDAIFMQQQMVPISQLAGRSDLNPKPPMMPAVPAPATGRAGNGESLPPAATGGPLLPAPPVIGEGEFGAPPRAPSAAELAEALMRAVYDGEVPPAAPRVRYAGSVLAYRHQQRKLIYGRQPGATLD